GDRARRIRANGHDARVWMRRSQHRRVHQARQAYVRGVLAAAGQEAEILLALHRHADHAIGRRRGLETGRRGHGRRWKIFAAFSPKIAASVAGSSPASRTTLSGSGSPIQNGWSLPSMTRSWPTSWTRY